VLTLLKGSFPDIKVLEVRPAQIKGLTEVTVESQGQKGILYVDSSGKYLVSGSILDLKTKTNFSQQRYNEINKVDISTIPLDDALVMGDKDAKYRVIVLDDPD
jgi:thiol:disulfide interchange protein DsbC